MALIKVTCHNCGDIELTSGQMHIITCWDTGASVYRFSCSQCHVIQTVDATRYAVDILLAIGCRRIFWTIPDELQDPNRLNATPITHDDLLDFHQSLCSSSDVEIIRSAEPLTLEYGERYCSELRNIDSSVIERELQ